MSAQRIAAVLSVLGVLAAAPAHAGKAEDSLVVAFKDPIDTIDRLHNGNREGLIAATLIWDTLLYRDPVSQEYRPSLATAWRWTDERTLEFDLRRGVAFHNGEPFDADDVVFTLNYATDPASKIRIPSNANWIERAEKLDTHKVRVRLKQPFPAALDYFAVPLFIYPNEYYGRVGPQGMGREPVGTGPYRVTEVKPGQQVTFERHPGYWSDSPKGRPAIGRIVMRFIPDATTQLAELMSGRVDWLWEISPDQAERLRSAPRLRVAGGETMRISFLGLDAAGRSGASPVSDPRVRRAIAHAIDRRALADAVVGAGARPLRAPCFPAQFGCAQDGADYAYDPQRSRELLREAGHPAFSVEILNSPRTRRMGEVIVGALKAVGIEGRLLNLQTPAFLERSRSGAAPIVIWNWGSSSVMDVSHPFENFFNGQGDDYTRDPELSRLVAAGNTSIDPGQRLEHYRRAIARIAEQAYVVPLTSFSTIYAFSAALAFEPHADEIPRFYRARWN